MNTWSQATQRHRDESWAVALLSHPQGQADLINCLSPSMQADMVVKKLAERDPVPDALLWAAAIDGQWDQETSRALLESLARCYRSWANKRLGITRMFDLSRQLGLRLSPVISPSLDILMRGPAIDAYWDEMRAYLNWLLSLRRVIEEEIRRE